MKISVIIPTRNRPDLLKNAVQSVIDQKYVNFELIIADNSSNAESQKVVLEINDLRISYFQAATTLNVTENWNRALKYATGDYILMLGDDDALVPDSLTLLVEELVSYPNIDCAYVGCYLLSLPNVFPGQPEGFLRTYRNRSIYDANGHSFILNNEVRNKLVEESMNFIVSFDYNPQFWVMSRTFLESNFSQLQLYKSPYPDYYAAIALMHLSKWILVIPEEIVIIGITKQSHGYLHFTGDELSADKFLTLGKSDRLLERIVKRLIVGNFMTNMWAVSLEYIHIDYSLGVNWKRYRKIQFDFLKIALLESRKLSFSVIRSLNFSEIIRIFLFFFKTKGFAEKSKEEAIFAIRSKIDTHPSFQMENLDIDSPHYKPIYQRFENLISSAQE